MDYIYVYDDNNNKIKMEVVIVFDISDSKYHYIIYRSLDKEHTYYGKYLGDSITDLITDLTEKEMLIVNTIYEELEGEANARSE